MIDFVSAENITTYKAIAPLAIMAIASAASAASALMKAGTAAYQRRQARKLEEQYKRPEYEIPESMKASLAEAQRLASGYKMPGQDIMESKIRASTAGGAERLKELAGGSAGVLGGVANLAGGEQRRMADLEQFAAQDYQRRSGALRGELRQMAGAEQLKQQWDKLDPYMAAMRAASALKGASMQNWGGAVNQAADFGSMAGRYLYAEKLMGGGEKSLTDTGQTDITGGTGRTGTAGEFYQSMYDPATGQLINPFTSGGYYGKESSDIPEYKSLMDYQRLMGTATLPFTR